MLKGKLSEALPETLPAEVSEVLVSRRGVKFERIVSYGHASPPDFWYDQEQHEFVLLVQGHAVLEFEDAGQVELGPGDWIQIDAHVRHRVHSTAPDTTTLWLVAFFDV